MTYHTRHACSKSLNGIRVCLTHAMSGTGAPVALVKRSGFDIMMLFSLSSTAAPEFLVNVGAGMCSLAIDSLVG